MALGGISFTCTNVLLSNLAFPSTLSFLCPCFHILGDLLLHCQALNSFEKMYFPILLTLWILTWNKLYLIPFSVSSMSSFMFAYSLLFAFRTWHSIQGWFVVLILGGFSVLLFLSMVCTLNRLKLLFNCLLFFSMQSSSYLSHSRIMALRVSSWKVLSVYSLWCP